MSEKFSTVDEYIASFPPEVQEILQGLRRAIHRGMPGADERMSYGIAAFKVGSRYGLYLGGWKSHAGLYPVHHFDGQLERDLEPYRAKKDTLKLPYAKPIPYELIERLAAEITSRRE